MLPLDQLFAQFVRERIYLKNVSPKTVIWYQTAWTAFRAGDSSVEPLTKSRLHAFVLQLRERKLSPVSCNTYMKAINAFCGWLAGSSDERIDPQSLTSRQRTDGFEASSRASLRISGKAQLSSLLLKSQQNPPQAVKNPARLVG